jgi:hypothetical protein
MEGHVPCNKASRTLRTIPVLFLCVLYNGRQIITLGNATFSDIVETVIATYSGIGHSVLCCNHINQNYNPWLEFVSELCRPSDHRLLTKLVPTFEDIERHVVSVSDPYGRNLSFPERSPYFSFEVASQFVLSRMGGPRSRPTNSQKIW